MDTQKRKKLKNLTEQWPSGIVATSAWLNELSISRHLVQRYLKSGWIKPVGHGAYRKANDQIRWYGAVASLQRQLRLNVHLGGPTAMSVHGASHYVRLGNERVFLFSQTNRRLPQWFRRYDWENPIVLVNTGFLPDGLSVESAEIRGVGVRTSSKERAILECLYVSPKKFALLECHQILEGLVTLRPKVLQELLVQCSSIRVKRLFLYMAEKADLPVLRHLNAKEINLGKGDRVISRGGVYNSKYGISLPRELVEYE